MSIEQEKIEIHIKEDMDISQRTWLVAKLEHERGIIDACFENEDHHRLIIHYEPEHFSHVTLLDTIKEHGYHGEITDR